MAGPLSAASSEAVPPIAGGTVCNCAVFDTGAAVANVCLTCDADAAIGVEMVNCSGAETADGDDGSVCSSSSGEDGLCVGAILMLTSERESSKQADVSLAHSFLSVHCRRPLCVISHCGGGAGGTERASSDNPDHSLVRLIASLLLSCLNNKNAKK